MTLCVSGVSGDPISDSLLPELLTEAGFTVTGTVRVESGKEGRVAALLLREAASGGLVLTVGALPFVHTMRNEFYKELKAR